MLFSPLVESLLSPNCTDISLYGAKAANLAKAAQFGFVVPEGFAVSRLCTEDEFAQIAQGIIGELSPPVAVRSSATNEDSATQAFAGQFETCLGVSLTADLMNAFTVVKRSGSTNIFKKNHGDAIPTDQIAVLIQRMVDATRAGVAFSRDPSTGEPKVIIESNYGLGKSVVDGAVTPDSIDYLPDGTYRTYIGRKSIQIILADNGVHVQDTPTADSQRCSLAGEEISEIANLVRGVERDLGFPADIEWAFDSTGTLFLLQARPITTL